LLIQVLYTVRSDRMLCEQLPYNLLFRWFDGLGMDSQVWVPAVFTKNRDRLLQDEIAEAFSAAVLAEARRRGWRTWSRVVRLSSSRDQECRHLRAASTQHASEWSAGNYRGLADRTALLQLWLSRSRALVHNVSEVSCEHALQ
jgi:hypothetical protein